MNYCINIKQSKAKQSKAKRELHILTKNSFKIFLIALLSLTLLFFTSCGNDNKTGSENPTSGNETGKLESGSGSGTDIGTGGSGTETDETETIEIGNFPPPLGKYRDKDIYKAFDENPYWDDASKLDVEVSEDGNATKIKGYAMRPKEASPFDFNISKWKKTTKGGKIIKVEAEIIIPILECSDLKNIIIVYDYVSSTLYIRFIKPLNVGDRECLFNGTKLSS